MAQQGWISVHRKIKDCWLYNDKPFDRTHAWIDLLLSANHQDKRISIGNQIINVERGSFITSEVKLAARWGWSRKKVRGFIEVLEQDKMLVKKSTSKYTSLTIENYSLYQNQGTSEDTAEEHQKNSKGTSKEQQRNTNNNDNNENHSNNENNENKKAKLDLLTDYSSNVDLVQALKDFKEMRNKIKKPMTERALNGILNKLNELAADDETKIKILEQSIINSWAGVFELKEERNGGHRRDNKPTTQEPTYDFSKYS